MSRTQRPFWLILASGTILSCYFLCECMVLICAVTSMEETTLELLTHYNTLSKTAKVSHTQHHYSNFGLGLEQNWFEISRWHKLEPYTSNISSSK